jgi:hypothetical protein
MAMIMGMSGKSKLLFLLMFGMIGIRFGMFVLSSLGIIAWATPTSASVLSWILPVGMPVVMISYMLLFRRRQMMQQRMTHTSDDATATASSTPQLFPPMTAMQHLLSKKSHKKRNVGIVVGIVGFMIVMHVLVLGGFIVQGAMAPYGIIAILVFMGGMFVVHSWVSKRKPSAVHTPASPKE